MTRGAAGDSPILDDAEIRRRLGSRIRELRDERGLSQESLAERAGGRMSYKHVGAIERGNSKASATSLVRIALGLGVTVGELFDTITPGRAPRLPRRAISVARESLRSLTAVIDVLERQPPPEGAPEYELSRTRGTKARPRNR